MLRWNLSSRARELTGGDAIVISIPKSGRTWVRTFLAAYFSRRHNLEFTLDLQNSAGVTIPRIVFTHDIFENRTKGSAWDWFRGKYLIPPAELRRAKLILLAREPRDCFVSLYLQLTHRTAETPAEIREKSITEMLRDSRFGIEAIIRVMNQWMNDLGDAANFSLVRYESLRASPAEGFRTLLMLVGEREPDMAILNDALEFSRFENMQKMEAAGSFESKILKPGDSRDPESFKVRRGKIGGFSEYLSGQDLEYASAAMKNLDPRFGYG